MSDKKDLEKAMKVVYDAIQRHGIKKIIDTFKGLDMEKENEGLRKIMDFIMFKTCESYQITLEELRKSKKRGKITEAREMTYILFIKQAGLSQSEVADSFDRDPSVICRALEKFEAMSAGIPHEKQFMETFEKMNAAINQFKEEMIKRYADSQ